MTLKGQKVQYIDDPIRDICNLILFNQIIGKGVIEMEQELRKTAVESLL